MYTDVPLSLKMEETRHVLARLNMVEASLHTSFQDTNTTLEVAIESVGFIPLYFSVLDWKTSKLKQRGVNPTIETC